MATTYEIIASVTVGSGGAADIEFTSIPATYTDLNYSASNGTCSIHRLKAVAIRFNGYNFCLSL
jgi:hypothetical protein